MIGLMVLNHNGKQWLSPLFDSIRSNGHRSVRIYLIDNGSNDGSAEFTLSSHPDVTVIRIRENLGYAMAYNLAMPRAFADGCDWVIWANNDILLEPGCLRELDRAVQSDPGIGVAGPAFLSWNSDEPNYYMEGKHPALIPAMKAPSPVAVDVDWVEGSFLMVSRNMVETVGPLDPRFFAFWEEADFCRRVHHSGRRVVLVPGAMARHYGRSSFSKESSSTLGEWLQSRNYHIYKLTDPRRSFGSNLLASAHLLATNIKSKAKSSPGAVLLELRAWIAVLVRAGVWYRKWRDDRRHIPPAPLDRRHQGAQPEILPSISREQALGSKEVHVSVVVPVRDRSDLMIRCLDSLTAQDFPGENYEIIVCDDGSTMNLSAAVSMFRPGPPNVRLVRQDCRGPAAARNLGIRESNSPIVLFVDSDVIADKGLIRHLVAALRENPGWAGAEASLLPVGGAQNPMWEGPAATNGGRFHTAAIAYRRDALVVAGGLDETFPLPACEDVELAARILPLGEIGFVPDAKAWHPRRKMEIYTRWRSRLHWKYLVILAKRYGFLAFPERKIGRFSRLRVAWAAVVSLPLGRLLKALHWMRRSPLDATLATLYALFDIACGLCALPLIFFCSIPERMDYLRRGSAPVEPSMKEMQWECHP
jgi:GT2 family glycosyltransferase